MEYFIRAGGVILSCAVVRVSTVEYTFKRDRVGFGRTQRYKRKDDGADTHRSLSVQLLSVKVTCMLAPAFT